MVFAGLETIVAIGTIGFWVMLFAISCCMVGFLEFRRSGFATLTFILTLFVLSNLTGMNVNWFVQRLPWVALYVFLYVVVVGVLWAVFKWWRKVENLAQKCKDLKCEFLRKHSIVDGVIPTDHMEEWQGWIRNRGNGTIHGLKVENAGIVPPHPNDYKEEIYLWIFFWPWSMLWFVFDEPVRKLARALYRRIRGSLVAISEHSFKDIKGDFAPPPVQVRRDNDSPIGGRRIY